METKEDNGRFVFEPDQFLTPTQIRSFFSRLTATRRDVANKTQSQLMSVNQNDDEDVIAEQENEFNSAATDQDEDSLRSQALHVLQTMQSAQRLTTASSSMESTDQSPSNRSSHKSHKATKD